MKKTFVPAHTKAPTPATKQLKQHFSKSPEMPRLKGKEPEPKSLEKLDKSNRGKRNEGFFQNAQNKDVIKTP